MMKTFYINIGNLAVGSFLATLPILVFFFLFYLTFFYLSGHLLLHVKPILILILVTLVCVFFSQFLFCSFLAAIGRIKITDKTLIGSTFYWRRTKIDWSQIATIRLRKFIGTQYLILPKDDNDKSPLWLPLEIMNFDEFARTIVASAPEGNPLRTYFELELAQRELLQK